MGHGVVAAQFTGQHHFCVSVFGRLYSPPPTLELGGSRRGELLISDKDHCRTLLVLGAQDSICGSTGKNADELMTLLEE